MRILLLVALVSSFLLSRLPNPSRSSPPPACSSSGTTKATSALGVPIGGGIGFKSPHGWGIECSPKPRRPNATFDSGVRFDSTVTAARARTHQVLRKRTHAAVRRRRTRRDARRVNAERPAGLRAGNNVFTCTSRDVFRSDSTDGTLSGFAGVRIPAGSVLFVRPEFEISKAGEHMRIGGIVADRGCPGNAARGRVSA